MLTLAKVDVTNNTQKNSLYVKTHSHSNISLALFSHTCVRPCTTIKVTVYILDEEQIFAFAQAPVGRAANREADTDVAVKCHFHFHLSLSGHKGVSPPS